MTKNKRGYQKDWIITKLRTTEERAKCSPRSFGPGDWRRVCWEKYRDGMTVAETLVAGITRRQLWSDQHYGHISISPPKTSTEARLRAVNAELLAALDQIRLKAEAAIARAQA